MSSRAALRVPNREHTKLPWRVHDLTHDFRLEDVWALPTPGGPDGFPHLVHLISHGDAERDSARLARVLWALRWKIGNILGWDNPAHAAGTNVSRLADRLPEDLRRRRGPEIEGLPFRSLYMIDDEWAAEIINRTVHGVMHVSWVRQDSGHFTGRMAVYVKPRGLLGAVYMAAIRPFRHVIVYPQLLRELGRRWGAVERIQRT